VVAAEGAKERAGAAPAGQSEMNRGAGAHIKGGAEMKGRAETTGSGANEMKAEPKAEMKSGAETKGRTETKGHAGSKAEMNKAKPSTTGAGPSEENKAGSKAGASGNSASEMKSGTEMKSKSGAEMKSGTQSPSAAERNSNTTTAQGAAGERGGAVNLTSEQKTKIRTTVIEKGGAPKISRSSINFNISVGTVVPRTVHFVSVPPTLIEIHPAWRGYEYFVVDEQIVIIDPHTLKIVAVLDV
jgi:hypothetical protein